MRNFYLKSIFVAFFVWFLCVLHERSLQESMLIIIKRQTERSLKLRWSWCLDDYSSLVVDKIIIIVKVCMWHKIPQVRVDYLFSESFPFTCITAKCKSVGVNLTIRNKVWFCLESIDNKSNIFDYRLHIYLLSRSHCLLSPTCMIGCADIGSYILLERIDTRITTREIKILKRYINIITLNHHAYFCKNINLCKPSIWGWYTC